MHIWLIVLGIFIFIVKLVYKTNKEPASPPPTATRIRVPAMELPVQNKPLESLPANPVNFDRLATFIYTPRTYYGALRAIVGEFQGDSAKWKWVEEIAQMPLIYYSILEAPAPLYYPGSKKNSTIVIIYAENPENHRDLDWLKSVTPRLQSMLQDPLNENPSSTEEIQTFFRTIQRSNAPFCIKVPTKLSDGAIAWCASHNIANQEDLPLKFIPNENILPAFLHTPDKGFLYDIPAKYYQ